MYALNRFDALVNLILDTYTSIEEDFCCTKSIQKIFNIDDGNCLYRIKKNYVHFMRVRVLHIYIYISIYTGMQRSNN